MVKILRARGISTDVIQRNIEKIERIMENTVKTGKFM
jgi:hypothetical protein